MALALATVANSIEALVITGLTIYDLNNTPASVDVRTTAALVPLPDYVTGFTLTHDTFGAGDTAAMTVTYNVNYCLFYSIYGAGRTDLLEKQAGLIAMVAAIWDSVITNDTLAGCVNIEPVGVSGIGIVIDPSNHEFLGCKMSFVVTEFVN